jgi:hypothetical protein
MKVAISLPDPIFEAAEAICKRLGVPRSRFYAKAIEGQVRTHQADEIREALDEVYGSEASSLDPTLKRLQADALREEW